MVKVVMVHLDGSRGDDVRLAAAGTIARLFEAHLVGLYCNPLPMIMPAEADIATAQIWQDLMEKARSQGDATEEELGQRLAKTSPSAELRRFDIFADVVPRVAAREARTADAFVTLRIQAPGAPPEADDLIQGVLFGSGRHLVVVPGETAFRNGAGTIVVAWNGSRESARALSESLPYLRVARAVTVLVIDDEPPIEDRAVLGTDAVGFLRHHGIEAALHRIPSRDGDVSATLLDAARALDADALVMGGYGHSRLREWLLGGTSYHMLRNSPLPIIVAH